MSKSDRRRILFDDTEPGATMKPESPEHGDVVEGVRLKGVAEKLDDLRASFENGEGYALLEAVGLCLELSAPTPDWVLRGYHEACGRWERLEVEYLGEAFNIGRRLPKGTHLSTGRKSLPGTRFRILFSLLSEIEDNPRDCKGKRDFCEQVSVNLNESGRGDKVGRDDVKMVWDDWETVTGRKILPGK